MAITDAQKVDLLYKKIGFGVAKTDTSAFKSPSNEANASPLLTRGDTIWVESGLIPAIKPAANTSVLRLYEQSLSSAIECTLDSTVSGTNRTWLTNYSDWVPAEFGSSYQVKVYAAPTGNASPETYGTQLFADGSGNSDAWYFDYQSGILNFPDTNVPTAVTGKKIYVIGARYVGLKGVGTLANLNIGNLTVDSISINNASILGGYITNLANISVSYANIISGNITANITGNVNGTFASFSGNVDSSWINSNVASSIGNFANLNVSTNLTTYGSFVAAGNVTTQMITSPVGDLHLSAATNNPNNIIRFDSVSAFDIPSGNTAQRPPSPDYGYVRYNTDQGSIEWWSGTEWTLGKQLIYSESITPNGVDNTYTLNQSTTENSILVNINGTVQQAGAGAYSVVGDQITFAEIPLTTDIIEIRYLAGGIAALSIDFENIASNVSPSANVTYDLGSSSNRWRDLWLSGNTIHLGAANITSVGTSVQLPAGSTIGGANVDITSINSNIIAANTQISIIQSNLGAYQNWANLTLSTVANAVNQQQSIDDINANIGSYQTYANLTLSTVANAVNQQQSIDNINANIESYQTYANANVVAIQANIGAFYNYANTKIGTNSNGNLVVNATTTSTSLTTGALVVSGGAGIAGNLNLASGSTSVVPLTFTSTQTTGGNVNVPIQGAIEANIGVGATGTSANVFYATPTASTASGRALIPVQHTYVLGGNIDLYGKAPLSTLGTTNDLPVFGNLVSGGGSNAELWMGNVMLAAGTTYEVEMHAQFECSAALASTQIGFRFNGNATLSYQNYKTFYLPARTPTLEAHSAFYGSTALIPRASSFIVQSGATPTVFTVRVHGLVRINGQGTLCPTINISASQTTQTIKTVEGSFIKWTPIGTASNIAIGTTMGAPWAGGVGY